MNDHDPGRRHPWQEGPAAPQQDGWLALDDDELLYRIEAAPAGHASDSALLGVVRSNRHFFIRQEAAKKIGDVALLKDHSADRHIGQILVRGMTRREDIEYLQRLADETRHLEVRKAAEAQLRRLGAPVRERE
ncbi:MAG: hypothetical protein ACHQNV_11615 [Vicinamibacteria bacterium]